MSEKRSQAELRRIVEEAFSRVGFLRRRGLWLGIHHVEASGHPIHSIRVAATLHFLPDGSPYCCGEPGCHLGLDDDRLLAIGDEVRRLLGLRQEVSFTFGPEVDAHYHEGIEFVPEEILSRYAELRRRPEVGVSLAEMRARLGIPD